NASSFHGGKLEAVKMTCDAKAGLEILKIALGDYKSAWGEEIEKAKQGWKNEYERLASLVINEESEGEIGSKMPDAISGFIKAHGGAMAQTAAIAAVREEIPEDAVIVGSAGSLPGDLQRMWTTDEKDAYNMEYGYSCMGYEIAGALGSKLAEPEKEVYAMVGDGSFFMLHSELVTALQERVKINVMLFDNASFGCINNLQMEQGVDALCTELRYRDGDKPVRGGEFMNVDFAKVAEGYGCKSYTARTIEELRAALRDSLKQSVSTLIDIKVAPKTMTHGYDGWWNVGVTQAPRTEKQKKALKEREEHLLRARKY
ncbi:MAG TPA: 3D-(3,5/4)-trihydroxycyclohexane-1,2-dione acylhydrolase (decyclizing), partial [Candidatus Caccalectryoclostridium excrementigallinarum]|nr:3D-(3,5/4)-trihydroxycyclohexane-1,2-dione acylhydrolase (decyclizing) [Candidatus Caccalectryoclostridium excrementigallinarum]